jgi:pSer/pThr/pTyr-binding forkhead associated (FHA) protein
MSQRNSRLIAGVYQVGQMITSGPLLTSYTAYNRNTSDVVGLLVIELPATFDPYTARQLLAPLARRRAVQSPHVIRVYDWGVFGNQAYIATDPPRGITLQQVEDTENIDLARSLDLAIQLTRGVAALQAHGIIDTDLRPQMITVDTIGQEDRVQLDDVGLRLIFRQLGYAQGQSTSDISYFDPRYMAPENIYQGVISSASDVYQLGLLLFELITGRPPFVGRTTAETGVMQSTAPVPHMAQFKHDTPPEWQEIVERALAKNPQQRYPHASAMLAAVEAAPRPRGQSTGATWEVVVARPGTPPGGQPLAQTREMVQLPQNTPIDAAETLIENERTLRGEADGGTLVPENAKVYAYLDLEKDGEMTKRVPIQETYVIVGRVDPKRGIKPEIDLTPFDPQATVSRQHARIRFEKTFFYIEDLKSRNKTRLGELVLSPLKPELLQHGDVVYFGSLRMVFRIPGMQDKPTPRNL